MTREIVDSPRLCTVARNAMPRVENARLLVCAARAKVLRSANIASNGRSSD